MNAVGLNKILQTNPLNLIGLLRINLRMHKIVGCCVNQEFPVACTFLQALSRIRNVADDRVIL